MNKTFEKLKHKVDSLEVDKIMKTGDNYAQFPYVTILGKDNAAVYVHGGIEDEARSRFDIIPEPIVDRLFTATSVASAVMRRKVERMRKREIAEFYQIMSSPDGVCRSIYDCVDNLEIDESKGGLLIDAARAGDFINDISKVNAIRLAMRLASTDPETLSAIRFAGLHNIESTFDPDRMKYTRTLELFGTGGPLRGTRIFMGSMPEVLIAAAFPMSDVETEAAVELLI